MGRRPSVSFKRFVPLTAAFFGSKPGPVDILAKVKLGMTYSEIEKAAHGLEKAGAPKGNGSFIPYEAEPKGVRINIRYNDEDKAEQYVVELPAKGAELVTKAWGARAGKARGLGSPMNCWDGPDGSVIELDDNRLTYTTKDHSVCEVQ